jgi:hypothetical protein
MLIIDNKVNRKRFKPDLSLFLICEEISNIIFNHLQLLESQQRSIWF